MDDVARFCARMLGDGPGARTADESARAGGDADRSAMLRAAVTAVRQGSEPASEPAPNAPAADPADDGTAAPAEDRPTDPDALPQAIARELAAASAALPLAQREALALRELLRLSYAEVADATGVAADAVPLLLAQARLDLRAQLRGAGVPQPECDERERALRTIALRQDGEEVPAADEDWLIEHLGHCRGCRQAHAAMLEASACYRAWASPDLPADPVAGAVSGS
ncbi:MAG TPA: sigma factor-like helix-turn-helix DNA-binding protein [Solirubrobacteraceae bacterium]